MLTRKIKLKKKQNAFLLELFRYAEYTFETVTKKFETAEVKTKQIIFEQYKTKKRRLARETSNEAR